MSSSPRMENFCEVIDMDVDETRPIPVFVQPECVVGEEHIQYYDQDNFDRCANCGSTLFRNYAEPVREGDYTHQICAVCNHRLGGILNPHKEELHYLRDDCKHPFMCVPIKPEDVASFNFDIYSNVPAGEQFMKHLEELGYRVIRLEPIIIR